MKGLISTLQNIWKIEDLRARILFTLGMVFIFRVGSFVVLPGIDPELYRLAIGSGGSGRGLTDLINIFSGGGFNNASVMALGIMPYISASIAVQLLTFAVPYFQKLQKEGESGRRQINQITRYLTVLVTIFQGSAYYTYLKSLQSGPDAAQFIMIGNTLFWLTSIIVLSAGTLFSMWLGEKITDKGIGNGISLLIMIGIVATLPAALISEFALRENSGALMSFVIELVFLVVIVLATVALVQGVRRVPVQYARQQRGKYMTGGHRQYLPIKVNAAGVMPIIFAQALMFIPQAVTGYASQGSGLLTALTNYTSVPYNIIYFILVVVFTYFYTAITVNPVQMADELKRNNGFIPGVRPGRKTAEFLDTILSRVTLPGSFFLGFIAILPAFAGAFFGVSPNFALFFGGTSLLIMVGVVLDTLQQIESHLLMRHYDGLMKSGRIKGRAGAGVSI
jgi:preprotein translocase subunit SecY